MPYIEQSDRLKFTIALTSLVANVETPGELNYCITKLCLGYVQRKGECYMAYNDVVGVLTCACLELYRRHVAPYEDTKIIDNGDVI